MTPRLWVPPPQRLVRAILVGWGTDLPHHHPWDDLTPESWQQKQDTSDPARGTERHRCSRKVPGLCHVLPPLQSLLAGPAALAVPLNPPGPKHRAARRGFAKRRRTTEKQRPKFKHVYLQEWPDPGRAPHTEVLPCHRSHMCEGKGTHAVLIAPSPSPLQFHNCLKSALKKRTGSPFSHSQPERSPTTAQTRVRCGQTSSCSDGLSSAQTCGPPLLPCCSQDSPAPAR